MNEFAQLAQRVEHSLELTTPPVAGNVSGHHSNRRGGTFCPRSRGLFVLGTRRAHDGGHKRRTSQVLFDWYLYPQSGGCPKQPTTRARGHARCHARARLSQAQRGRSATGHDKSQQASRLRTASRSDATTLCCFALRSRIPRLDPFRGTDPSRRRDTSGDGSPGVRLDPAGSQYFALRFESWLLRGSGLPPCSA